jgi:hypothetical protein
MYSMSSNFDSKRRNVGPRKFSSQRYYGKQPIISHDFHPGFKLDGYDLSGMSYGWKYNGHSTTNHESAYGFPQPPYADLSAPRIRSFEELQVERSYLISSLQREDSKATDLLKKIRYLQESCHDAMEGSVYRKLKKQLGHFKNRMCQCTKQEKMILARLGQVTYEIQSKERWSRIENERLQQWNCHGLEQMHLDATCPEFVPHNAYSQQWAVQPAYHGSYGGGYSEQIPPYGGVPELHPATIRYQSDELYELPCDVSRPVTTRVRSASMINLTLPKERVKRLSMPELSMGDSEGDASSDDDHRYIGYYISKPAQ